MTGTVLNCGYLPLVDCAPLVIAKELGFAGEEGLDLNLVRRGAGICSESPTCKTGENAP
ncbi:ABC transporter substrate-binding protein, partial [Pseudooctadecabacter sp.]|uniref:ABC transporter substrate-binding protein n=1 Tax=Pseudooctadecabacter sp. TaxID=1966338 RepID=UPI0035C84C77